MGSICLWHLYLRCVACLVCAGACCSDSDNEASRRIKTEFLIQLDGAGTKADDKILVVGATNKPSELDEAARRRFIKRLYIPLPDSEAREYLVRHLLSKNAHGMSDADIGTVVERTNGYSGADVTALCREAAMGPLRAGLSGLKDITKITADSVPPIQMHDFEDALGQIRASVAPAELKSYRDWNTEFGSFHGKDVFGDAESALLREVES